MDDEAVLVRIDVRIARVRDHEVQAVWCERAVDQMVRRARMLSSRLPFWVAERSYHIFFESRTRTVIRDSGTGHQTPRIVSKLLGGCGLNDRISGHRSCQCRPATEKGAAVKQTIACNGFKIFHGCPPEDAGSIN